MNITITELSDLLDLSQEVLRKYEKVFSITVGRNEKGNRIYNENNVKIFQEIKHLAEQGRTLKEIKLLLNMDNTTYSNPYNQNPKVEVIQEEDHQEQNYSLLIKPYIERITKLENLNTQLMEETKLLIKDNATLTERVKNKDDIVALKDSIINDKDSLLINKDNQIMELRDKLNKLENRRWWHVWK